MLHHVLVLPHRHADRNVERKGFQVAQQPLRLSRFGRFLPAYPQSFGHRRQLGMEAVDDFRRQGMHDQLALAAPLLALGREHAHCRRFFQDAGHTLRTPPLVGAVVQDLRDIGMPAGDDEAPVHQAHAVNRAILARPLFQLLVEMGCIDSDITHQRQAGGSRQVIHAAPPSRHCNLTPRDYVA